MARWSDDELIEQLARERAEQEKRNRPSAKSNPVLTAAFTMVGEAFQQLMEELDQISASERCREYFASTLGGTVDFFLMAAAQYEEILHEHLRFQGTDRSDVEELLARRGLKDGSDGAGLAAMYADGYGDHFLDKGRAAIAEGYPSSAKPAATRAPVPRRRPLLEPIPVD